MKTNITEEQFKKFCEALPPEATAVEVGGLINAILNIYELPAGDSIMILAMVASELEENARA